MKHYEWQISFTSDEFENDALSSVFALTNSIGVFHPNNNKPVPTQTFFQ